jgi:hypothetical protein
MGQIHLLYVDTVTNYMLQIDIYMPRDSLATSFVAGFAHAYNYWIAVDDAIRVAELSMQEKPPPRY